MICLQPVRVAKAKIINNSVGWTYVPCGTCVNCMVKKQQDWIFRLSQELKNSISNYFVTLTFNEENLKDIEKRELQLFFKTLRNYGATFKYFAVGEYGTESERPHYHIAFFGMNDITLVEKYWTKGFVHIKPVYEESLPYLTSYLVTSHDELHKPFRLMSKGLGISYVDKYKKFHKTTANSITRLKGGHQINIPRYYREKIFSRGEILIINQKNHKYAQEYNKDKTPEELYNKAENLKLKLKRNKKVKL